MLEIHLPLAEISVSILDLFLLGGLVGFLSGMFGVGGGFLMTPMLIFLGIPPAVAVASDAAVVLGASVSGLAAHLRRRTVDFKMGTILFLGGIVGSVIGTSTFRYLRDIGQIDVLVPVLYVIFLGIIGALMTWESARAILRSGRSSLAQTRRRHRGWVYRLPLRMRFRRSRIYVSALLPLIIGCFVGLLAAMMGVGGGFIMVPAMIYLLGMPTSVVVGTSLFQITFVMISVTFLHSVNSQTVDVVLALLVLLGAAIGAQVGSNMGAKLKDEQLRGLLALIVLATGLRMGYTLVAAPDELFVVEFG